MTEMFKKRGVFLYSWIVKKDPSQEEEMFAAHAVYSVEVWLYKLYMHENESTM